MDVGQTLLGRELRCLGGGVVEAAAVEDHSGPVALGILHLDEGSGGGHDHSGGDACFLGGVGHTLGMVAGRGGDQAQGFLLV